MSNQDTFKSYAFEPMIPKMNSENASAKPMSKIDIKLLLLCILGGILCIVGIVLLNVCNEKHGYEIVKDYTDCMDYYKLPKYKCKNSLEFQKMPCICFEPFNLTQEMDANVTVFFEYEAYFHNAHSRDDEHLSTDSAKAIAPYVNDTVTLRMEYIFVPQIATGINPLGNLEQAAVGELDSQNPDNNGIQNEDEKWHRKLAWRVNHTGVYEHGLPAGSYMLRIEYAYPTELYNGRRRVIISSIHHIFNPHTRNAGIALLVIGLVIVTLTITITLKNRLKKNMQSVITY